MSQHMYQSGRKMRKIQIVPPKLGKILKIGKKKYIKARPNLKKLAKKKEILKRMMEVAEECTTQKNVTESAEEQPSKISKKVRSRTSKGKALNLADESIPVKYADHSEEINAMVSMEKVPSDSSSERSEPASDNVEENLTDSDESISLDEDNADVKHNVDDNDSDFVVVASTNTVADGSPNNKLKKLSSDRSPCLRIKDDAKAEFHHLSDNSYILILRYPGQLYFRGTLSVTPVSGITSFLGYELMPGMKSHIVYSPKGISPMFFSTTGNACQAKVPKIPGLDKNILNRLGEKDTCLLMEPASGEHWINLSGFFNRLLKLNPLAPPKCVSGESNVDVEADLGVEIFQPSDSISFLSFHRETSEWKALSQEIWNFGQSKGFARVMVCGGKGVGKSTFMRFLVNQWLSSCNESKLARIASGTVLFLDFDPGQSEFVPPGCVSVTLVSEPLLGPNYTHLKDPERMLCLGELDVSRCPKWYLYCADDLVKFCSSEKFKDLPWFINTMGFCKGIGADLTVELIRLCRPSHVIQLTSVWSRRNFEPLNLLSWQMVKTWKGQKWNQDVSEKIDTDIPEYLYHQLQSLAENTEKAAQRSRKPGGIEDIDSQWGFPAWQLRELCILAYFSKIVKAPQFSILDAVPHTLRLPNLVFSLPSAVVKPQYVKSVFNAALVALSSLGKEYGEPMEANQQRVQNNNKKMPWHQFEERANESDPKILYHMPLASCHGFGLVRAMDDSKEEIYITSPLSSETMSTVDCLATGPKVGSIPAPMMINSFKESNQEEVPYLMKKDQRTNMNRYAPRVFQPHLAYPGAKRFRN